jgi:hypothetical protein
MKLLNSVTTPVTANELAGQSGLGALEIHRAMQGFMKADLVTCQKKRDVNTVIAVTGDAGHARQLSDFFRVEGDCVCGKVVRDALAVKLLSRRFRPSMIVFDFDCEKTRQALQQLAQQCPAELAQTKWVVLTNRGEAAEVQDFPQVSDVRPWPESVDAMRETFAGSSLSLISGEPSPALVN